MAIIVIVDDDPAIRLIAGEMLRHEDYAVVEASDGAEVLEVASILPIDLVILDLQMPRKDGLETIAGLKIAHPDVRILAISSGDHGEGRALLRTALDIGADDALPKPLHADSFAHAVTRLLATPAADSPTANTASSSD